MLSTGLNPRFKRAAALLAFFSFLWSCSEVRVPIEVKKLLPTDPPASKAPNDTLDPPPGDSGPSDDPDPPDDPPPGPPPVDPDPTAPPPTHGFIVGQVAARFLVRIHSKVGERQNFSVMLPLPDHYLSSPLKSFGFEDPGTGTVGPAQVDVMTRAPNGMPEVVRVSGSITVPPEYIPNTYKTLFLRDIEYDSIDALLEVETSYAIPSIVSDLLEHKVYVLVEDAWGYRYITDVFNQNYLKILHQGPHFVESISSNTLLPIAAVDGSKPTYPHLQLIRTHLIAHRHNQLMINLLFNNGMANTDPNTDIDNPIGSFPFKSIDILVPKGIQIRPMFKTTHSDFETSLKAEYSANPQQGLTDKLVFPQHNRFRVVKAHSNGKFHFWHALQSMDLYLGATYAELDPSAETAKNIAQLSGYGLVMEGSRLGWWGSSKEVRHRLFPQRVGAVNFNYITGSPQSSKQLIRTYLASELQKFQNAYEKDLLLHPHYTYQGDYAKKEGAAYGGVTGGGGIATYDGDAAAILASGSWEGLRLRMLRFIGVANRQNFTLVKKDGLPPWDSDYLVTTPGGVEHIQSDYFDAPRPNAKAFLDCTLVPPSKVSICQKYFRFFPFVLADESHFAPPYGDSSYINGPDKFGYHEIIPSAWNPTGKNGTKQIQEVIDKDLFAPYAYNSANYKPMDSQHYVRLTGPAKTIAWLTGFYPAIVMLEKAALYGMHTYSTYKAGETYAGATNMYQAIQFVENHPGRGMYFGRGQAWITDAMNAYMAFADDSTRAKAKPWYDTLVETMNVAQIPCNGRIAVVLKHGKSLKGNFSGIQSLEERIGDHARLGMYNSVYKGTGDPNEAKLLSIMQKHLLSIVSPFSWHEEKNAEHYVIPYFQIDANNFEPDTPNYCFDPDIEIGDPAQALPKDENCGVTFPLPCSGASGKVVTFYHDSSLGGMTHLFEDDEDKKKLLCGLQKMRGGTPGTLLAHLQKWNGQTDASDQSYYTNGYMALQFLQYENLPSNIDPQDFCSD